MTARGTRLDWLPIRKTLARYHRSDLRPDLIAALNVALLAFPQGMAYAMIAGLPIAYGIFGSAIAAFVASIFSRTRFIMLGPSNATAVMLASMFASVRVEESDALALMPLLLVLVGTCLVIGAYLKVATLVQYISRSVISGYITAAALLIITGQIPNIGRLELSSQESTFFGMSGQILQALDSVHWNSVWVGLATALVFVVLNHRYRTLPNVGITLVSIAAACAWIGGDTLGIRMLSGFEVTHWSLTLPVFSLDSVQLLVSPALALALLCVMEGVSIGKDLAAKRGARVDANQEMFSMGMANIGCGLFSGMPASGSLTRSSLGVKSGSKTALASGFAGLLIAVGAFLVGPLIQYIPQASLAVLVVIIGLSLINRHSIRVVTRTTKSDAAVFLATFLGGMFLRLDQAIYLGVGLSIILFLKKVARPEMVEYAFNEAGQLAELDHADTRAIPEVSIVHVEGELFFGAAELFRDQTRRVCEDPNLKIVVLKMRNAHNMDASAALALEELVNYMNSKGRYLIVSEARPDLVRVLKNSGVYDLIEERNIFAYEPHNPTLSTANALKRAKEHLGDTEANVSIYVDPVRDKEKGKASPA